MAANRETCLPMVLVCETGEVTREMLVRRASGRRWTIRRARPAGYELALAETKPVLLIIADDAGCRGLEVLTSVQQRGLGVPVVYLNGSTPQALGMAWDLGAIHAGRPCQMGQVVAVVEEIVRCATG